MLRPATWLPQNRMALAMPKPGSERTEWVERMVAAIDAKLGELAEIDEISGRL
jgi:hypothetical protein